jgi:prepilin-type N-terminal cleavage/methylation domain-containing protein
MRRNGFTLIEVLVFLIVSSLLMSVILLSANTALRSTPSSHNQWVAMQVAKRCMEWFLDQRRLNGYATLTCPSAPSASACTAPTGFSVANSVACTTWNSDSGYISITVTVSGLSNASISTQIADY